MTVLGQVKALTALELQVLGVAVIEGLRNELFLYSRGLLGDLPPIALQICDPILIGFDAGGTDHAGDRRIPAAQTCRSQQDPADYHSSGGHSQYRPFTDPGGNNKHSATPLSQSTDTQRVCAYGAGYDGKGES